MARRRADALLVARGLARSREQAQAAIAAGGVSANGAPVRKASMLLAEDAALAFAPAHVWASRAGLKLAHALEAFAIGVDGAVALDVGAAAGGFVDVLLARGAGHVYAVDVGRGQLDARLRADPRVAVLEQQDARTLTREQISAPPALVTCDASFIGLEKVLPRPLSLAAERAALIALVKPQFESGPRRKARLAPAAARRIAEEAAARLDGLEGFRVAALIESPIEGGDGAVEFLLHAAR